MRKDIIYVFFILALAGAGGLRTVQNLDAGSVDLLASPHPPDPDIAIVAIDSKSLAALGRWPWPREIHAELLKKLSSYAPRAVGYDVSFSEPEDPQDDAALGTAISNIAYPLVLPLETLYGPQGQSLGALRPREEFVGPTVTLGSVNVALAPDGLARDFPAPVTASGTVYLPFSLEVGKAAGALLPEGNQEVNFAGPAGTFPAYSASDLLAGAVPEGDLNGKIILVGATASDLHDVLSVPPDGALMAGVEWHANVLDNILLGRGIVPTPRIALIGITALFAALLLLLFDATGFRTSLFILPAAVLAPVAASYALLRFDVSFPSFYPALSAALAFIMSGSLRWYRAELEKRKLKRSIELYFSPQIIQAVLQDPESLKLGGTRREVTVLFSDIRSFTTITESAAPEALSRMLHEYFTEMAEEVFATDGVLDKFIGDAIMAFWGAPFDQPDHADRAVRAAQGMMRRLKTLRKKFREEGLPAIDIGIGVSTGYATVGNMGSAKRFDYTVIGDSVNAASRLEGLNKEYKTHIIISEAPSEKLKEKPATRALGSVQVKGKTASIMVYEVNAEDT